MLLITGILGCAPEPSATTAEALPPADAPTLLTEITLPVLSVDAPFRFDAELRGLATTVLELGLSDLPGVIVRVPGDSPPPVWALHRPHAERSYTGTFHAGGTAEALTLTLTLCEGEACRTHSATGSREAPYPALAALLTGAAEQLGAPVEPAVSAAWSVPGSKDTYAELITGRGCATYLGLMPPPADPADRKQNAVLRAVFIDPGHPIAQWMWARWQIYTLPGAGSGADTLRRAALARPSSPLLRADLATTLALTGKGDEAALVWQGLAEQAPADPRWVIPYATTLTDLGRAREARAVLDRLPPSLQRDPAYTALAVRVAEGMGEADLDPLLARWQDADPASDAPVRRRIQQRVADGRYADALALLSVLRTRAPGPQTDALEVALLTATGQLDAAADRAPDDVAERLRARSALEADPGAAPTGLQDADGALAVADARLWGNQPGQALDAADQALRARADANAWTARARALEASGRTAESVDAWQEAWRLDPTTDGGPVSPRRIASTFRIQPPAEAAPVEAPEPGADASEGPRMGNE